MSFNYIVIVTARWDSRDNAAYGPFATRDEAITQLERLAVKEAIDYDDDPDEALDESTGVETYDSERYHYAVGYLCTPIPEIQDFNPALNN